MTRISDTSCPLSVCDGSGLLTYDTDTTECPCRGGRDPEPPPPGLWARILTAIRSARQEQP